MLFRSLVTRAAFVVMVILMPLSRMYLGRHFVADVLAGFALGLIFLGLSFTLFVGPERRARLLDLYRLTLSAGAGTVLLLIFMLIVPLILVSSPLVDPQDLGRLFGLNVAFLLLAARGLPRDAANWIRRTVRVILAFSLYAIAVRVTGTVVEGAGLNEDAVWLEFVVAAAPTFLSFWGGVTVGRAAGLFPPDAR